MKFHVVLIIMVLMVCVGCGPKGPKNYECSGTVTFQGKPVDGATVTFVNPDKSIPGSARTDAEGKFILQSQSGDYQVTIIKLEGAASDKNLYAASKMVLPEKYANIKTSGLKASVSGDKTKDVYKFELVP